MKKITNYNDGFKDLFTINVDQTNRTCKIIGYNKNNDYILQIFKEYNRDSACSGTYEYYLLNKSELHNYNIDTLYHSKQISLLCYNNNLVAIKNKNIYKLSSNPYEPCLYINLGNEIKITIHSSFSISEIIDIAKENKTIRSISGNDYDIEKICNLLLCAIDNNLLNTDINYLEKYLKINNQKEIKKIDRKTYNYQQKNTKENNKLIELVNDLFYKEYEKYPYCVLDYCIIKNESTYNTIETHKDAVIFSMEKWKNKFKTEYDYDIFYNPKK